MDDDNERRQAISESTRAMHCFLSQQTYEGHGGPHAQIESEATRLMEGESFDSLADLGDNYVNAFNKLNILLWLNDGEWSAQPGDNPFWEYISQHAFNPGLADTQLYLETWTHEIEIFLVQEFNATQLLEAPIPSLHEHRGEVLTRFRLLIPSFTGESAGQRFAARGLRRPPQSHEP